MTPQGGAQARRPEAAALGRFCGVARGPNCQRHEIVDVSGEQTAELRRRQAIRLEGDVDVVDEEPERLGARRHRADRCILRRRNQGSEVAARNPQREVVGRSRETLCTGLGARQQDRATGIEAALSADL